MNRLIIPVLVLFFVSTVSNTFAAELAGVEFNDQDKIQTSSGSIPLVLNGLGLRTATIFKVKVYAAGLYLKEKTSDPQAVLTSKDPKKVIMKFVRDVEAKKLADGWKDGFKNNAENFDSLKDRVDQFGSLMPDTKDGDVLIFEISNKGVKFLYNGEEKGFTKGADFSKGLLSVWFGPKPPNKGLKTGMLGVK